MFGSRGERFPHLRVGTFIEAFNWALTDTEEGDFPTFGWGLSLRQLFQAQHAQGVQISPPSGGDFH